MDPLKAAAATLFCLVLFWVVFRLTRRLMEMAIAAGHAEERRRVAAETRAMEDDRPQVSDVAAGAGPPPPPHVAGAVP